MDTTQPPFEQQPQEIIPPQDPAPIVSETYAAPVSTGSGWLTGKIIAIILGIVVVAGGVAGYFMFFRDSSPVGISSNTGSKSSLDCKDLLPESDFQRIIGKSASEYELVFEDNRLDQGEGGGEIQAVKDTFGVKTEQFASGARTILCSWFAPEASEQRKSIQTVIGANSAIGGDVSFALVTQDGDMTEGYETQRDPFSKLGDGTHSFGGQTITVKDGQVTYAGSTLATEGMRPNDIPELGAAAFEKFDTVTVLSSNRKYIISIFSVKKEYTDPYGNGQLSGREVETPETLEMQKEIAGVINSNL